MTQTLTLAEALAQLRDYDADQVATLLHLAGKTGDVGDTISCPVANYLADVLGEECVVDTSSAWLTRDTDLYNPLSDDVDMVDLPSGVMEFVERFDDRIYPDLITPEETY